MKQKMILISELHQSIITNDPLYQQGVQAGIEQSQARIAELEAENARLKEEAVAFASNLRGKHTTTGATYAHLRAQLATVTQERDDLIRAVADHVTARGELAAQNQQMRRALTYIGGHIRLSRLFACEGGDSYDPECADLNIDKAESFANEALATPDLASPVLNKIRAGGTTGSHPDNTVGGCRKGGSVLASHGRRHRERRMAVKEKIQNGHRQQGRWIIAPIADIIKPQPGRICYGPRWWAATKEKEVLFFDTYGSPQCNVSEEMVRRLGKGFDAPETSPVFLAMAFLPHRCEL